jgi:1-aminocyclopropane-1-carboxylate deaminase/D-cysteine desulfhydrase-like pyridoxal-dependent ACC family enzyme
MIPSVAKMPRLSLGHYPTPLTEAKVLSRALGGPRILIKRDDLSGLVLGGNKCRHIEFLLGHVKKEGYDMVLCGGGSKRSNYGVQLLAAAQKAGVKIKFYMKQEPSGFSAATGNSLLHNLMESDIHWVAVDPSKEEREGIISHVLNEEKRLRQEGRRPYVMQTIYFNETPIEQTGWVNAADEIYDQLQRMNITAQYSVIANGQGGTQAGLMVGTKYLKAPYQVIGICILFDKERQVKELVRMTNETAQFLEMDIQFTPDEMMLHDEYRGQYGIVSKECAEAIKLVAQTEGILLDPVYTGKAMAGLIDLIRKGRFTSKDTVVFIHTGGVPDLFLYGAELSGMAEAMDSIRR